MMSKKIGNHAAGIERMLNKVNEMNADPAYISVYQVHSIAFAEEENERLFGATSIELLGFFYTCRAYDELITGSDQAVANLAQGLAHYVLSFTIYVADLAYVTQHKLPNHPIGSEICLLGFARAVSYGRLALAKWWAKQLQVVGAINYSYLEDSLPDQSLARHLLLLAKCWLENRWCSDTEISDSLGVYKALWECRGGDANEVLKACAFYHLREAFTDDFSPFGSIPNGPYPLELIAWGALYERVFSREIGAIDHPLFQNPIVLHQRPVPNYRDEWLDRMLKRASDFYCTYWPDSGPNED